MFQSRGLHRWAALRARHCFPLRASGLKAHTPAEARRAEETIPSPDSCRKVEKRAYPHCQRSGYGPHPD